MIEALRSVLGSDIQIEEDQSELDIRFTKFKTSVFKPNVEEAKKLKR